MDTCVKPLMKSKPEQKKPSLRALTFEVMGEEIKSEKYGFIWAGVFHLLSTLSVIAIPWILQQIVDTVLPEKDMGRLYLYSGAIVASVLMFILLYSIHIHWLTHAVEHAFARLRRRLMASILSKEHGFFGTYTDGDLITRTSSDLEMVSNVFFDQAINALFSFLFSLVLAVAILIWKWELGVVSLLSILVYGWAVSHIGNPVEKRSAKVRDAMSRQNTTTMDLIGGEKEIRFFRQQRQMVERFEKDSEEYRVKNTRFRAFSSISLGAAEVCGVLIGIIPFLFGGWLILIEYDPTLTIGVLFAYYTYVANLILQLFQTVEGTTKFAGVRPVLERLEEILSWPEEPETEDMDAGPLPAARLR